jgi:hypothetical protein
VLEMRPACETCATALPAASADAMICSFECTFCTGCAAEHGKCPNCSGELTHRPARAS